MYQPSGNQIGQSFQQQTQTYAHSTQEPTVGNQSQKVDSASSTAESFANEIPDKRSYRPGCDVTAQPSSGIGQQNETKALTLVPKLPQPSRGNCKPCAASSAANSNINMMMYQIFSHAMSGEDSQGASPTQAFVALQMPSSNAQKTKPHCTPTPTIIENSEELLTSNMCTTDGNPCHLLDGTKCIGDQCLREGWTTLPRKGAPLSVLTKRKPTKAPCSSFTTPKR
jgi:hypothetical protein